MLRAQFEFAAGRRVLDRGRPAHRAAATRSQLLARTRLQPRRARRAGLRPGGAEGGEPHPAVEMTLALIDAARANGFRVGQPRPDLRPAAAELSSFHRTLDKVLALRPDRIALYNYAHLPAAFKPQRRIDDADLPTRRDAAAILRARSRELRPRRLRLHRHGPLRQARRRTRGGAARRAGCTATSRATRPRPTATCSRFGVSAIGKVGPTYARTRASWPDYYRLIERAAAGRARHRAHRATTWCGAR